MSYHNIRITGIPAPLATDYDRQANFTDWEVQSPGQPPRGVDLDAEFNAVQQAVDETQDRLRLIQRDDGAVANRSIGIDQLKTEARVGVNTPEEWAQYTQYQVNDSVIVGGGAWYICGVSHVSSNDFQADYDAGYWTQLINLVPYTSEAYHWATYPIDSLVPEGNGVDEYSSLHHRHYAETAQTAAETARDYTVGYRDTTAQYRQDVLSARDTTYAYQQDTLTARDTTLSYQFNAQSAQTAAETAQSAAEAARDTTLGYRDTTLTARNTTTTARDTTLQYRDQVNANLTAAQAAQSGAEAARDTTLIYRDTTSGYLNDTRTARDEAQAAQGQIFTTRDETVAARDTTLGYRNAAQASAQAAATSENNAADSAQLSADNAITFAIALG